MPPTDAARRRLLLLAAFGLAAWAIAIALTGGFALDTPAGRISSRDPFRAAAVAAILAAWYVARWRDRAADDLGRLTRLPWPRVIAATFTAVALLVGLGWGTFIAGGPDAAGYVSQADMWLHGRLTIATPAWVEDAPWHDAAWSSAPIGYRPAAATGRLAPTYAPGLPLLMALFQFAGGCNAVFLVVPLLGALAVWATYVLGRRASAEWAGAIAAVLFACSPAFLWMLVQPMADVPAAACWIVALCSAWRGSMTTALVAGAAAALAIVIRPNTAPLAAVVAALLLTDADRRIARLAAYAAIVAVAVAFIAATNAYWYGAPWRSGYGGVDYLYSAGRVWPNLQRYGRWMLEAHTPAVLLAFTAPLLLSRTRWERLRIALLAPVFAVTVLALYLPYLVFDDWRYLRFLLPAFPPMFVALGALLAEWPRHARRAGLAAGVAFALTAILAIYGWHFARREGAFGLTSADRRYARAVEFTRQLPENAVLVSLGHSGTLHYYTGRDVLRWEILTRENVDHAIEYLSARGYPLYVVADTFEVSAFKKKFAGTRAAAIFDAPALADVDGTVIYRVSFGPAEAGPHE